ncbi:MAG: TRIC cation channel family protein, partial [Aeromicrobium sp.]
MTHALLVTLEHAGIFIFAMSGALVAARLGLDIFGLVVLGLITGLGGGVTRDIILGIHPPAAFDNWGYLLSATAAAVLVFFESGRVGRRERPILLLDAVGLSLFCVTGAIAGVDAGLGVLPSSLLGLVTAVGGGAMRDVLSNRVPVIFQGDLYALPALLGAVLAAVIATRGWPPVLLCAASATCLVWRLA